MPTLHPHRSMLYMPASNARALEKSKKLTADGYIFDLEDAVSPEQKALARTQALTAAALAKASGPDRGRKIIIRANGLDTPWGLEDLKAIAASDAHGVLLPKIYGPQDVLAAEKVLKEAGAPDTLERWIMMETPAAFLNAAAIAASLLKSSGQSVSAGQSGLTGMVIGSNDLIKDMRARHTDGRAPILAALGLAVLAARANGLVLIDAVYGQIQNDAGLRAECAQGLAFGFDGKSLIHPNQINAANEIFAPSPQDIAYARQIITAHADAVAAGRAVATLNGQMIEALHVEDAKRQVALARQISAFHP